MSEEPAPDEASDNVSPRDAARNKAVALRVLLALFVVAGIADALSEQGVALAKPAAFLARLVGAIVVSVWCCYDGLQRDCELGKGFMVLILLLMVVGFPAHAFRTRGTRGFRLIGWSLLVLFVGAWLYATGYYPTLAAVRRLLG